MSQISFSILSFVVFCDYFSNLLEMFNVIIIVIDKGARWPILYIKLQETECRKSSEYNNIMKEWNDECKNDRI